MDKEIERIYDRVDELLEKECYLIDVFPRQISEEKSRQYLALEEFYSSDEQIKKISGQKPGHVSPSLILGMYSGSESCFLHL